MQGQKWHNGSLSWLWPWIILSGIAHQLVLMNYDKKQSFQQYQAVLNIICSCKQFCCQIHNCGCIPVKRTYHLEAVYSDWLFLFQSGHMQLSNWVRTQFAQHFHSKSPGTTISQGVLTLLSVTGLFLIVWMVRNNGWNIQRDCSHYWSLMDTHSAQLNLSSHRYFKGKILKRLPNVVLNTVFSYPRKWL